MFAPLNPPLRQWHGRRVWIIGASSGIGAALARALLAEGADVIVSSRRPGVEGLADAGTIARLTDLPLDVSDPAACVAVAQTLLAQGPPDVVVYCAGTWTAARASDDPPPTLELLERHLDVNYHGALRVILPLLPALRARGTGHLCLVSSVAGWTGLPRSLAYGPTKAALTHLAEVLYLDLQALGIGVSVVHPGFVATPLTATNSFHMPALLSPDQAAQALLRGWARGHFNIHFPRRFTLWLQGLRLLPYRLVFRLVRKSTGL